MTWSDGTTACRLPACTGLGSYLNMIWTNGGLILNIAGRAFSGAAFSAVYVWSTEIFPSSLRQTAMGMGSMSVRAQALRPTVQ
jgi:hypothetical protein